MFKVLKPFELDGKMLTMGEEIFLSERDATKHLQRGEVQAGRVLDPENEDDAKKIKEAEAAHDARYEAGKAKEAARDEAKQDELKEDDGKRKELVEEAEQLLTDIAAADGNEADKDELAQLSRIETPELEKRVAELREKKAEVAGEDKPEVDESMKRDELEKIARDEGISDEDIDGADTKADLVELIEDHRSE